MRIEESNTPVAIGDNSERRVRLPSAAIVIACVALAVALGGTSYAAFSLPANSVGTKQLKNGAVTKAKISARTITGLRGATGTRGLVGPAGPVGAGGAAGSAGQAGAQGPPGPVALAYIDSGPWSLLAGAQRTEQAICPPGWSATGGGAIASSKTPGVTIISSDQLGIPHWPADPGSGWQVSMSNASATDTTFYVDVICAVATDIFTNSAAASAGLRSIK
jgi:hypothetical protein